MCRLIYFRLTYVSGCRQSVLHVVGLSACFMKVYTSVEVEIYIMPV